jgi:hypothetical protein
MYAVIRQYRFDPKSSQKIDRQVKEGFVPLIRKMPGFVAYCWLNTGEGTGASLSVFKDKAGADESIRLAADDARQHLASLLGKPEAIEGPVKAHT